MKNVVEKRSKDIGHLRFKFKATAEGGNNGNSTSKFNTKQIKSFKLESEKLKESYNVGKTSVIVVIVAVSPGHYFSVKGSQFVHYQFANQTELRQVENFFLVRSPRYVTSAEVVTLRGTGSIPVSITETHVHRFFVKKRYQKHAASKLMQISSGK